jgi:hypothetical protein
LAENIAACDIELDAGELHRITTAADAIDIAGGRGTGYEQYG